MKPRVFISYVRENAAIVTQLVDELLRHGVDVWHDKSSLRPGERWRQKIKEAIERGDFFLACFSHAYMQRPVTYMNEELLVAIEQLRLRQSDRTWFIPVLLDDCEIPDREIGPGESLRDIQAARLFENWDAGVAEIVNVLHKRDNPTRSQPQEIIKPVWSAPASDGHEALMTGRARSAKRRAEDLERMQTEMTGELRRAEHVRDALPSYERGWHVEAVVALLMMSVTLEWFPMRIMSIMWEVPSLERVLMTAFLALMSSFVGLSFGELLCYRHRRKNDSPVDRTLLALASAVGIMILSTGYLSARTYFGIAVSGWLSSMLQATTVTIVLVMGMLTALVAGYCSESFQTASLRWKSRRLRSNLRETTISLEHARQDLRDAEHG